MLPTKIRVSVYCLHVLPFALISAAAKGNEAPTAYPIEIPFESESSESSPQRSSPESSGASQSNEPENFDGIDPVSESSGSTESDFYQPPSGYSAPRSKPAPAAPSSAPSNPDSDAFGAPENGGMTPPATEDFTPPNATTEPTQNPESAVSQEKSGQPEVGEPKSGTMTELKPDAEVPPESVKPDESSSPQESEPTEKKKTKKQKNSSKKQSKSESKPKPEPKEPPVPSYFQDKSDIKFSAGLENIITAALAMPAVDFGSFSNDAILVPWFVLRDQIYPSVKLSNGRSFQLNIRSRILLAHERASKLSGKDQLTSQFTANVGEIFAVLKPSAQFSLTAGKQNFQWGPAELRSPSNWIFRPTRLADTLIRNPQSEVETRDLVRMNFSLGQQLSVVAMAEYEPEQQERPRIFAGRRALIKPEYSWNNAANSVGIVLGVAEKQGFPFVGQYATYSLSDNLQIYADAAQFQGADLALPTRINVPGRAQTNSFIVYDLPELKKEATNFELVVGARYSLPDNMEVRAEGYVNSVGLDDATLQDAQTLERGNSPFLPLFFQPGAESQSKYGVLFAARRNNFGPQNKWTSLVRYLKPFEDSSGLFVAYGEYLFSDNTVFFASLGGYHGENVSAAAVARRFSLSLGHKHVW